MESEQPASERILCVDDDRLVRDILEQMLEELGLVARCVKDGKECIAEFEKTGGYDLVLVNYDMPEMDGAEVIRRLIEKTTPERLVITSAYPESTVFTAVPREHVAGFLPKPYTLPALRRFLRSHLQQASRRVFLAVEDARARKAYDELLTSAATDVRLDVRGFEKASTALAEANRSVGAVVIVDLTGEGVPPEVPLFHAEEIPLILLCGEKVPKEELARYGAVLDRSVDPETLIETVRKLSG